VVAIGAPRGPPSLSLIVSRTKRVGSKSRFRSIADVDFDPTNMRAGLEDLAHDEAELRRRIALASGFPANQLPSQRGKLLGLFLITA